MKLPKKCKFIFEGKKYFYLAKCYQDSKTPELFLVQWNSSKDNFIILEYPIAELKSK
jgi:hypothetical protein